MKDKKVIKKIKKIIEKSTGKKVKSFVLFADQEESTIAITKGDELDLCRAIIDQCGKEPLKAIVVSAAKQVVLNDLLQNDDEDKQN